MHKGAREEAVDEDVLTRVRIGIYKQGSKADALFFIISGYVVISKVVDSSEGGQTTIDIAEAGSGDVIAISCCFLTGEYIASAACKTNCSLLRLPCAPTPADGLT